MDKKRTRLAPIAVNTSVYYWAIGICWILFSDRLVAYFVSNIEKVHDVQTYKGWSFITVTAVMLYLILRQRLSQWEEEAKERKRAEENLRESELLFRNIFNQQFQYMAILETDGRVRAINDLPLRVTGLQREDYLGEYFWQTPGWKNLPEWQEIWPARLKQAAETNSPVVTQDIYQHPNGTVGYADATTTAVRGDDGSIRFFLIEAQDTTERKRAEIALQISEDRLRQLHRISANIDLTHTEKIQQLLALGAQTFALEHGILVQLEQTQALIVYAVSADHSVTANFQSPLGTTLSEEVIRTNEMLAIEQIEKTLWREQSTRTADETQAYIGVPIQVAKQSAGVVCFVSKTARPVPFTSGDQEFLRLLAQWIGAELTRYQAEEEFRKSVERQRLALEAGQMGTWCWYPDTGMIEADEICCKLIGIETITGPTPSKQTFATVHPDDQETVYLQLYEGLEKRTTSQAEYRVIHADQSVHWLFAIGRGFYNSQGVFLGFNGVVFDITARKEAEQQLKQWADAFEHSALGLAIGNPITNRIMACNPAFARMQQLTIDEVVGVPILSLYPPSEQKFVLAQLIAADEGANDRKVHYESRIQRKDGTFIPVQVDVISVTDKDGKLLYRVATRQDISARKQAEELLRYEKERLEKLAIASPSAMYSFRVTPNEKVELLYSSPFNYELYGINPAESEHVGEAIFARIHPAEKPRLLQALDIRGQKHSLLQETYRYQHPKKGEIWIEAFAAPTFESDGSVTWHGVANDVTERKIAEDRLRQSEERLKLALIAAQMGVWAWDLKTNNVYWSPECYEIFGVDSFDGKLDSFLKMLHPEDLKRIQTSSEQSILNKEPYVSEFRTLLPNQAVRWFLNFGRVQYNDQGEPVRLIGTVQDITTRKLAEAELEQSLEQVRSLALHVQDVREEERKRIARELHDELGQALAGLKFDLFWLENLLAEAEPSLLRSCQEKMRSMAEVITSTIEVGRKIATELRPRILDDLGLVVALNWQAQEFQTRTGIRCSFQSSAETIEIDAARATAVFRIFQETLTNVARHAQATAVTATLQVQAGVLRFQVQDNGRGITKQEMSGSGSLGLLGMRERVLLFGGEIQVHGQINQGTIITVSLPL